MSSINLSGNPGVVNEAESTRAQRAAEAERSRGQNVVNPATNSSTAGSDDVIRVSEEATAIGRLAEKAAQLPEIRQEKVAELRERLQAGKYNPAAADIADAIIKDEQA